VIKISFQPTQTVRSLPEYYEKILIILTLRTLKKSHTVTAVSESKAQLVQQDLGLTEPIRVIYSSVDTN